MDLNLNSFLELPFGSSLFLLLKYIKLLHVFIVYLLNYKRRQRRVVQSLNSGLEGKYDRCTVDAALVNGDFEDDGNNGVRKARYVAHERHETNSLEDLLRSRPGTSNFQRGELTKKL